MRIACVHEWLTDWGGSEDCVRQMLQCFPDAALYATIDFLSEADRQRIGGRHARTTFLQRMPGVRKRFWNYLPLTPLAVEGHDLRGADVILSSSHAFAKGVLTTGEQLHVSYVHSPMRYAWDLHHEYMADYGLQRGPKAMLARWMFHKLRLWDRQTGGNVDLFLANSHHVRRRIWRTYRRPARVIHPPVAVDRFGFSPTKGDHYVTVSRLVSYKRVDLLLEAFRRMPSRRLVVIGDGPEAHRLAAVCPPNVEMLGWQPHEAVVAQLQSAAAFVFAAREDFGISPVEAQACGTPVIALGEAGSLETVCGPGGARAATGLHFPRQAPEDLVAAVEAFEARQGEFDPHACRAWAEGFSEARFRAEYADAVAQAWDTWQRDPTRVDALAGPQSPSP